MARVKGLQFIGCLLMVLAIGGIAWGYCDPGDGNDTAADATPIGFTESVTGWVCPDDPHDYYVLDIPEGADVSGRFHFSSDVRATVLRVEHEPTGERIVNDLFTSDGRLEFTVPVPAGGIPAGRYIIRAFFWSEAAFDHEYTLTLDLTVVGGSECVPDDNETPETAVEIAFNTTVTDWLCAADHIDIWHFSVANEAQGRGTITFTANPGELRLYLYNSSAAELLNERTTDGALEYNLAAAGAPLENGEYYIGAFLAPARTDENSYSINLREGTAAPLEVPALMFGTMHVFENPQQCPWPNVRGNRVNGSRSSFSGPPGAMFEGMRFDMLVMNLDEMLDEGVLFADLIVANNNRVIFRERGSDYIRAVYTPNPTRVQWARRADSLKPPCLARDGTLYHIDSDGAELVCITSSTGGEFWRQPLPEEGQAAVELVGENVYTSTYNRELDSSFVQAWDWQEEITPANHRDGAFLWGNGPLAGKVLGIAEDSLHGVYYIQTTTYLYKFDFDGEGVWWVPLRWRALVPVFETPFAPMIGRDRRVWVYNDASLQYYVFNEDGSIYKQGVYDDKLRAACIGTNGRLYLADTDMVRCFDGYDDLVWERNLGRYVDDMVMGADDKIYVAQLYYYITRSGRELEFNDQYIHTLDPNDGHSIYTVHGLDVDTEVLEFIGEEEGGGMGMSCLAIGEGNKLAFLHSSGLLKVFNPHLVYQTLPAFAFEALESDD